MTYSIALQHVVPRPLAAVRESMAIRDVPSRFGPLLDQVYAAKKAGAISLDGQNIFVYHATPFGIAEVEFGVGTATPFAPIGRVRYSETPASTCPSARHHATTASWAAPSPA